MKMEALCQNHDCSILYLPLDGSNSNVIRVNFSNDFNRKPANDLDYLIENNWITLKKELGDKLYNGSKFRVHSVKQSGNDVTIEVGLTDYKDYVGTNLGRDVQLFMQYGENHFGDKQACLSDALGVGSMLLTADGYFLLVQRSLQVAEARGMFDFPGGHAEPMEMAKRIGCENIDPSLVEGKDVLHEIFHSMVREVRDEINIPEDELSWPYLLGFLRNNTNGGKPHAAFLIKCKLNKDKIIELFNKGGPEAYETSRIMFVKKEELLTKPLEELSKELQTLTPCAKATLHLYFCSLK